MTKEASIIKISLSDMTPQMGLARREAARLRSRIVKLHRWGRKRTIGFSEAHCSVRSSGSASDGIRKVA